MNYYLKDDINTIEDELLETTRNIYTEIWDLYFSQTSTMSYTLKDEKLSANFIFNKVSDITVFSDYHEYNEDDDDEDKYIATRNMSYFFLGVDNNKENMYADFVFNPLKNEIQLYSYLADEDYFCFEKKISGAKAKINFSIDKNVSEEDIDDGVVCYLVGKVKSFPKSFDGFDVPSTIQSAS